MPFDDTTPTMNLERGGPYPEDQEREVNETLVSSLNGNFPETRRLLAEDRLALIWIGRDGGWL